MDAQFLDQYENELAYLRQSGSEFAQRYPTLAGKLGLDEFHCSDPFVERLLEGFAFLSARVHRRLDAEFPRFTTSLLDSVFPLATRPVPSTAIFRIEPTLGEGSLLAGYTLPRGTRLLARPAPQAQTGCRFELTDQLQLWPVQLTNVRCISRDQSSPLPLPDCFQNASVRSVLLLTIKLTVPGPMSALALDRLRLHLLGNDVAHLLTEFLLAHTSHVAVQTTDAGGQSSWHVCAEDALSAVGYEADQALYPEDYRVFSGHRLLHEFFLLPEKFMFVDLGGLKPALADAATDTIEIAIAFDQASPRLVGRVGAENIDFFCVPAINLFKRRTDRVWLDHAQHEHHLIADRSRVNDYEIWSVADVSLHSQGDSQEARCQSLYAGLPAAGLPENGLHENGLPGRDQSSIDSIVYAVERRTRTSGDTLRDARSVYPGTESYVSLSLAAPGRPIEAYQQLSATTYCTNRALALLTPPQGWRDAFQLDAAGPISKVVCVTGPTPPRPAPAADQGEVAWRFVNHLTPAYASLVDSSDDGCGLLRDLLQLFCPTDNFAARRQIDGLRHVRNSRVVRRTGSRGQMTYVQGVAIELECDERVFDGSSAFLMGSVLEQFMARYVTLNSFVELHLISQQRGSIHRWSPRSGSTPLI